MNQITLARDVWRQATEAEKTSALAALSSLPSRQASGELDRAAYYVALDGVTRYGLSEAVMAIIRGALGHAFFPSPPELRIECDKAMEWPERQAERARRQERYMQERRENNVITQRSPEAITRQQEAYRKFCEGHDAGKIAAGEAERAEIRARYGMTAELIEQIPDQPVPSNFKRLA